MIKKSSSILLFLLIACGVIFTAKMAVDPSFSSMSLDGGAFAYCGQRITQGALLYRDCWDNKPPAIYYLNAAVIALGGPEQWNLWLLQAIWLSITALAFYLILENIWNRRIGLICTALMLLTLLYPVYFSRGNLTETYALLPITLILGSFWGYLKNKKVVFLIGIGLCTAIAFLFKPTYISMGIGALAVLILRDFHTHDYRQIPRQVVIIGLSFLVPLLLTASYWVVQHDLRDLLYAVFTHNQLYVEQGFSWKALRGTLRIFVLEQPLAALTALAFISLLVYIIENWKNILLPNEEANDDPVSPQSWVMVCLLIAFIFDFIFTTLPGKNFRHYFQVPILTLAASTGYLSYRLSRNKTSLQKNVSNNVIMYSAILLILVPWLVEVIGKELPGLSTWQAFISNPHITQYQSEPLEQFIIENTTPDQSILVWDYDPAIYFHVNRRTPTRFIFLRHIFEPIPGASSGFAEFMQSLQNDPPELIISSKTSQQGLPYLGMDDSSFCSQCDPVMRLDTLEFKHYVDQYYAAYTDIQTWAIYKRLK